MEEAVTKKCVYEESGSITALCSAVEACLSHGLKRRALGLFRSSSTTALIQRIAKYCPEAEYITQRLLEFEISQNETQITGKRYCSSSDSILKPKILLHKKNSHSVATINTTCAYIHNINNNKNNNNNHNSNGNGNGSSTSVIFLRYLWIRLALSEQRLIKIIEYLVKNAYNYYELEALIADPDYGEILCSLLMGPCALEYSKSKTIDQLWSDPSADELVQRHRISSGNRSPPGYQKSLINFKRCLYTNSDDGCNHTFRSTSSVSLAKDYVESLHQNSRAILLYGKNNVLVLPKGLAEPINGYLSLHQISQSLIIKWTPNELINGSSNPINTSTNTNLSTSSEGSTNDGISDYWLYALNIHIDEIVYVHCHQNCAEETGGTIILVSQDGVQQPPIHFPEGGHMQAFLNCLETGLLPNGQLDPPLGSQRSIGQIFSWSKSMRKRLLPAMKRHTNSTPTDYVFRVVNKSHSEEYASSHSMWEFGRNSFKREYLSSCSTTGSSNCSSKSLSLEHITTDSPLKLMSQSSSIELVCSTMKRQIISRAFYGWLAYCRHLSTVRTHLSGLVNGCLILEMSSEEGGLTCLKWKSWNGVVSNKDDVYRLVYFGGVAPEIRAEVWPYLLGFYNFGSTPEERQHLNDNTKLYYEKKMSEWLAVEAIVRQREEEKTARALAKIANEQKSAENSDISVNRESLEVEIGNISDLSDLSIDTEEDDKTEEKSFGNYFKNLSNKFVNSVINQNLNQVENKNLLNCQWERQQFNNNESNVIHMLSVKSSSSTSSYETVANEFPPEIEGALFTPCQEQFPSNQLDLETKLAKQEAEHCCHSVEDINLKEGFKKDAEANADEEINRTIAITFKTVENPLENSSISPLNNDLTVIASIDKLQDQISTCPSPVSSNGGIYSSELLENFALNLHRIEKDVLRCDRNYWYFAKDNLDKLRNVITTYVWEHLEIGYMQGMCDLVAPLLVIFDDESLTFGCFCKLMERMIDNFPNGGAMDMHFTNMRSLIQILDPEMYEVMDSSGDYTHFYFCYRWFLLDFKRELLYNDVFTTWEVIWAARHIAGSHFVLFIALALLETYRDIILSNSMDFIDVIKFFNEMAERHDAKSILKLARDLVLQLQTIIENK